MPFLIKYFIISKNAMVIMVTARATARDITFSACKRDFTRMQRRVHFQNNTKAWTVFATWTFYTFICISKTNTGLRW